MRALLRRGPRGAAGSLRHGDLELDPARREVRLAGEPVDLTPKEFDIVHVLLREPGRVFTRTEILERVYDDDFEASSNVVDVLLGRIRRKLAVRPGQSWIRTVRGVGYVLFNDGAA